MSRKKKTHEEYVAELIVKNPTVEVVGKYSGAKTKIEHRCLIHDVHWYITPSNALQGKGCDMCHKNRIGISNNKLHEQYILEVKNINPNIIVVDKYIDAKTPIVHKCTIHDVEWFAYPSNILKGHGCLECGNEKIGDAFRKSHEQYVKEVGVINQDIEVVERYINANTPILHRCKIDGYTWKTTPYAILCGYGCQQCNESSGERQVRQWLDKNDIVYEYQKSFNDCRDILPLPFDFYLPDYNVVIEYNGGQHYKPVAHFGGIKSFEKTVKHDKIKREYCEDNNIKFLCIPYFKNVKEELSNFLFI